MTFKKITPYLVILISLSWVSCEPSKDDIERYLKNDDYELAYNFLVDSINDQKARISDFDSQEKTAFETSLLGLLSSNSEYAQKAGNLITEYNQRIVGHQNLQPLLWSYLYEQKPMPEGVYQYLYDSYDFKNPDEQSLSVFRSDSVFIGLLKANLSEIINTNIFASNKIRALADAGNFRDVSSKLDEISKLLRHKNTILQKIKRIEKVEDNANRRAASRVYQNQRREKYLDDRIDELNWKLNKGLEDSFILRAYMIALIDQFTISGLRRDIYEIRGYSGNTMVLITTETSFSSKGTFSMRVLEFLDLPMKFKQQYGGFNATIKSYVEVSSSSWEDYLYTKSKIEDLEFEMELLSSENNKSVSNSNQPINPNLSNLKDQLDSYSSKISDERKELVRWANNNSDS